MKYLLDTNICIYIIKKKPEVVLHRLEQCDIGDVCISVITVAELEYGVHKSAQPQRNQAALEQFLAPLQLIEFDYASALLFGRLRVDLERQGAPIGAYDLLLAAHALRNGLTLITNNTREFERVKDLTLQNWVNPT